MNHKLLPVLFTFIIAANAFAAVFTDTTQDDFNLGSFNKTNATIDGNVFLNPLDINNFFATGEYSSRIFNANASVKWQTLFWNELGHYGEELPNDKNVQADASMKGNVLLLHLNETSGTAFADASGSTNNASCSATSCPTLGATGKFGKALSFDGNNDLLDVNNNPSLNITGSLTIEAWVKPNSWKTLSAVYSKTSGSSGVSFERHSSGGLALWVGNGASWANSKTVADLPLGTFTHIVGVYDGTEIRMYVNGAPSGTPTAQSAPASVALAATIGRHNTETEAARFFDGIIDEVAVYNVALSESEILHRYKRGVLKLRFQARSCDDASCSGESFVGPGGSTTSFFTDGNRFWDLNMLSRNRFFQYKAFFETEDTNFFKKTTPQLLDANANYNLPSQAIISKIKGFPVAQGLPIFSYIKDGNIRIDLNVMDVDSNNLLVELRLSQTKTQGSGTIIVKDFNLNAHPGKCDDLDFQNSTRCTWDLNIHPLHVNDGNYFVLVSISDGMLADFNVSENSFAIDNTPPAFKPIPEQEVEITDAAPFLVDLFLFASDNFSSAADMNFSIVFQSNTAAIDCVVEFDRFISCAKPKNTGKTTIAVKATDSVANASQTVFDIVVVPKRDIALSFPFGEAAISNNDDVGLRVRAKNRTESNKCISLEIETGSNFIEASMLNPSVCLSPNQETEKTFTLKSINAPSGVYPITITALIDGNKAAEKSFRLRVASFSEIEIIQFNQSICRKGFKEFSVQIKNNSGKFKIVELFTGNETLLPSISPAKIKLDAFESRFVTIKIFSSENTATGTHRISVFAKTDTEIVKEDIEIQLVDCGSGEAAGFSVNLQAAGCIGIDRSRSTTVNYIVDNKLDEEQEVNVSLLAELPATLRHSLIVLEPLQARSSSFEASAPARTRAGDYNVSLIVYNNGGSVEKTVCMRVAKARLSEVQLLNNNLVAEKGSNIVFTLLVSNPGDFENTYTVSFSTQPQNIFASISQDRFSLPENAEKEIYISVSATELAAKGTYTMNVTVNTDTQRFVEQIGFEVREKSTGAGGKLSITSYPIQARMLPNDERQLVVEIRNNSAERITGLSLGIAGLPPGIEARQATGIELLGSETRRITIKVVSKQVGTGNYTALLELSNAEKVESKSMQFIITQAITATEAPAQPTGFFALSAAMFSGIPSTIVWVILVLIILLIFIGLIAGTTTTRREAWLQKRW